MITLIASIVCLLVGVVAGWFFCRQTSLKHLHKDLMLLTVDMNQDSIRSRKRYDPDVAQQIDRYRAAINTLIDASKKRLI